MLTEVGGLGGLGGLGGRGGTINPLPLRAASIEYWLCAIAGFVMEPLNKFGIGGDGGDGGTFTS